MLPHARAFFSKAALADLAGAILLHRLRSETHPLPTLLAAAETRCPVARADNVENEERAIA